MAPQLSHGGHIAVAHQPVITCRMAPHPEVRGGITSSVYLGKAVLLAANKLSRRMQPTLRAAGAWMSWPSQGVWASHPLPVILLSCFFLST